MKSLVIILVFGFTLTACSNSKDEQFCKCMEVSEKFNETANKIIEKGTTPILEKQFKTQKKAKEKACKTFQTMGGKEMLEKKAACAN
ncbi:MAG: hypothetical protein HYR91_06600 [Flavobacteriia bacterium]|nr:hypothetical protein [Flavobacteriia bacterium]